jgi:hypothetical protein
MANAIDVGYNPIFLKLLRDLTNINKKFIIKKTEDEQYIKIESVNAKGTVAYQLKAKLKDFDFDGDEVGFYNYSEFDQLLNAFDEPSLKQNNSKFEIYKDDSKITYTTANPEAIPPVFKKVEFKDPDLTFTLTEKEIFSLKKMTSILGIDASIVFKIDSESKLTIKVEGEEEESSYQKEYKLDSLNEDLVGGGFSMTIPQDIFTLSPKATYQIQVTQEGIIRFVYKNEKDFELYLYTGETE